MDLILLTLFFKWVSRLGSDCCLCFLSCAIKSLSRVFLSASIHLILSRQVAAMLVLICPCLYSEPVFKAIGWLWSYASISRMLLLSCWASLTRCLEGQWRTDVQIKHWWEKGGKKTVSECLHMYFLYCKEELDTANTVFLFYLKQWLHGLREHSTEVN